MFVRIKCPSTVTAGDVLSYNSTSSQWETSADGSSVIAVARTDAAEVDDGNGNNVWTTEGVFSGVAWAKAHDELPNQGGALGVTNGRVSVLNQGDSRRVVLPNEISAPDRVAGDLVRVNIR